MKNLSILSIVLILLGSSFGASALPKDQEQFTYHPHVPTLVSQVAELLRRLLCQRK